MYVRGPEKMHKIKCIVILQPFAAVELQGFHQNAQKRSSSTSQ